MLDSQIHLYCVNTSHFYSRRERYLHRKLLQFREEKRHLKELLCRIPQSHSDSRSSLYQQYTQLIDYKAQKEKHYQGRLSQLLNTKTLQNEATQGRHHTRLLNSDMLRDTNVISMFESTLTRTIGIEKNTLSDALIVVEIYYFEIFKDILFHGFLYHGEPYRYFTSSAGQIRTKKAVFMKENLWNIYEKTLLCGLTIDRINRQGGNNVNKHLAYMALTNSATDEWKEFNIDKCIVIPDFETKVSGTYDLIDDETYTITRKSEPVTITHTDGAGMILPSLLKKNVMFRAPWIKGLLGVFDFQAFIREHHCSPVIEDIYGIRHDILAEDIQIILTKSQFKMHAHYKSWEEYQSFYKQYGCQAGLCNLEEDRIKNARLNYQMLQTLTDITEEEMMQLAKKSITKISNLCSSQESMMEALGITPYQTNPTYFQQAVKHYPALLNDTYAKDMVRTVKNSLLKKYRSGKLEINGKYAFLLPDFYAACQFWFCNDKNPHGLLADQEVYCRLLKYYDKLDCLRSPHLYREHAIRHNVAHESYKERTDKLNHWFTTNAIYTSCHDLISRLLQFDVDGDKSLVIADPDFVHIAQRNMKGIVPLFYTMKKAAPTVLNHQTIYNGLCCAFTGANIGSYSNDISKIWNSEVFITGSPEEQQKALDTIKYLCMENNFVIDYAKTLYKPIRPAHIHKQISALTKEKLPAFFTFAKDKEATQVAKHNQSFVNRLYTLIPDKPINTRSLKLEDIDYHNLMHQKDIICPEEVANLYNQLNGRYRYRMNWNSTDNPNYSYVVQELKNTFIALGYSPQTIADMLVHYTYGGSKSLRYKELLWSCFGDYILANIRHNVPAASLKTICCMDCGEWFEISTGNRRTRRCPNCTRIHRRQYQSRLMKKRRN